MYSRILFSLAAITCAPLENSGTEQQNVQKTSPSSAMDQNLENEKLVFQSGPSTSVPLNSVGIPQASDAAAVQDSTPFFSAPAPSKSLSNDAVGSTLNLAANANQIESPAVSLPSGSTTTSVFASDPSLSMDNQSSDSQSAIDFSPQAKETLSLMDCSLGNQKTSELWWVSSTNPDVFTTTPQTPIKSIASQGSFINWMQDFTFPTMSKFRSDAPTISLGVVPRGRYSLVANGSMVKDTEVGVQENEITFVLGKIIRPRNANNQACHYIGYTEFFIAE